MKNLVMLSQITRSYGIERLKHFVHLLFRHTLSKNISMKIRFSYKYLEIIIFFKEVRNATEAHIALMGGSPYVPRTLQMHLRRINICDL
jgi:hypothetical protein